jgi:hypothetical protein
MKEVYDINKTLGELEEELSKIKSAEVLIETAKNTNEKVLSDSKSLFKSELTKLKKTSESILEIINNLIATSKITNDKILSDSESLFDNELNKLQEVSESVIKDSKVILKDSKVLIEHTQRTSEVTIEESNKLNESTQNLNKATTDLLNEIKKINFSAKFEKLDTTLSSFSTSIQNIFGRFDTFETSFNEKLKKSNEEIDIKFKKVKNRTNSILILNWIVIILFALVAYKMYF